MTRLLLATTALVAAAEPALAGPVAGAVALFSGGFSAFAGPAIGSFLLRTAVSLGLSALSSALKPKPTQQKDPGIRTKATTAGGTVPQSVIFGRYATGGNAVCPPMTHGVAGSDTVDYLTYVIDLSDFRTTALESVIIDGQHAAVSPIGHRYGDSVGGAFSDHAWVRHYDGTQTAADPTLVDIYSRYVRPWTPDHVLRGVSYAIATFRFDREIYQGLPKMRFVLRGAPLYDPRFDTTAGGSGPQRVDDPDTWEFSENPVVMVYNLMIGLPLADGSRYGLNVAPADLPFDRWAAAMNVCDEIVPTPEGEEPRYRAGLEFRVDQEPLDVIADILKSCGGHIAESGGVWNVSVGPAALPSGEFNDDSIIVSDSRDYEPFRGLEGTYNAAHASWPNPRALWEASDAPPYYRTDLEAEDDGRRLIAELNLPSVPFAYQAQRLMVEAVSDNRRMASHSLTLPPSALGLLPLDTVSWTSDANGYASELFEVYQKTVDPRSLTVNVQLRNRNPADYEYEYDALEPVPTLPGVTFPFDKAPPKHEYDDPDTGLPIVPTPMPPDLGRVVALHDRGVSQSIDAGASWTFLDAAWSGAVDLSAIRGAGFVVVDDSGGAYFSSRLTEWEDLRFKDPTGDEISLPNGDFESGSLSNWTIEAGAPVASDRIMPEQRPGSSYYLTSSDGAPFVVSREVSVGTIGEARAMADLWCGGGATAFFELTQFVEREIEQPVIDWGWREANGFNRVKMDKFPKTFVLNGAANSVVKSVRARFFSGLGNVNSNDSFGFPGYANTIDISLGFGTGGVGFLLEFLDENGDPVRASGRLRLSGLESGEGQNAAVEFGAFDGVSFEAVSGTWTGPTSDSAISNVGYTSGSRTRFTSSTGGSVDLTYEATTGFYLGFQTYFGVLAGQVLFTDSSDGALALVEEVLDSARVSGDGWVTRELKAPIAPGTETVGLRLRAEGDARRVAVDNVRLEAGHPGYDQARCVARDLAGRRHVVATGNGIHAVDKDGAVTELGEAPLAADHIAAHGGTIVIAARNGVAISTDDGATWTTHTGAADAVQVNARGEVFASLDDGALVSVAAGGLSSIHTFARPRRLAYSTFDRMWYAVGPDGTVERSADLVSWSPAPDMPEQAMAGDRAVVPLEFGRFLGFSESDPDLFWREHDDAGWRVKDTRSAFEILDMQEVK